MKQLQLKEAACEKCGGPYKIDQNGKCLGCGARMIPASYAHFWHPKGAVISDCNKYRYKLWRVWDPEKPAILFIMLNPSTADAFQDDRTIKKCIKFSKAWGYGSLYVCNLFAYRTKKPVILKGHFRAGGDVIGPDNRQWINETIQFVDQIVCAWGADSGYFGTDQQTFIKQAAAGKGLFCLEKLKDGHPKHPLYCKGSLTLTPYEIL